MVKLEASHPPDPVSLSFRFKVDEAWIEEQIVATGKRPASIHELEIPLVEVDKPTLRRRLLHAERLLKALATTLPILPRPETDPKRFVEAVESWLAEASRPPTADEFGDEMRAWVDEHGSERLRMAVERGYKVNATYARERAALEFPGFWVDTSGAAKWRDRTDPSLRALELETATAHESNANHVSGVQIFIVWLIEPPTDLARWLDERDEVFDSGESLVVLNYLGRYTLVRPIDLPEGEDDPNA